MIESIGPFRYERYVSPLPALEAGHERQRHQVVIVGGGPVGLALALGLARHGVASVVLEADDTVCMGSRAACISRRSLQILERLGVLETVLAKGLAWTSGRSFYQQTEVFRFDMPHDASQKLPPMINLQQYYIEQFLVDEIRARYADLVEIRWGSTVSGLTRLPEHTTLQVSHIAGNETSCYTLDAAWVVACDGGQSFVRRQLGLTLSGTGYEGKYVIVDIEADLPDPVERRAWFDPPSNPGWTMLMHCQPDNLWRIDYQVPDDTDLEAALTPAAVTPYVERQLALTGHAHRPWKLVWSSAYRAGAMTLERYRHGRILFAGNAAHALPIFGVRGLNSGFDDADNLAWKLAGVVQGWGADSLLESYSSERVQAFHVNAASAMRSTEFMAPPSRGYALMREAALSLALQHREIAKLVNPRQTSAIEYLGSPLSNWSALQDKAAAPGGQRLAPGQVMPDVPVTDSHGTAFLSDMLGPHFTLMCFGAQAAHLFPRVASAPGWPPLQRVPVYLAAEAQPNLNQAAQQNGAGAARVVTEIHPGLSATYGTRDGEVWLVRPDGHLCARWHEPTDAEISAALQHACGHAGTRALSAQTHSEAHHAHA
ncbi:FAD-dependent monooxygenase [Paraburkholderia bonniea]|uniref:FAD-dependent monooxygenase n=1 Tax=Paraburkholderia bonniea TaxID=2152891 RepID=UPI0025728DD5|nr:FAD-dependent monooxygenase [Paraburkholderia bonniea]WJF92106.1 FAD-dependent monooxygenase [Paraburkholderia bonniea]WJF95426.1 FAD-dependent monooxygenase [Paraburkholderia bonniea]